MQRDNRFATVCDVVARTQPRDAVSGPQTGRDRVGQAQQPPTAALVDRQLVHPRRPAATAREMVRKAVEVRNGRTTPTVDGLAWIADGRHRMTTAEQACEHLPLRYGCVLVLVQQHDPGPGTLRRADRRHGGGQSDGVADQITEVDDVELAFGRAELRDHCGELPAGPGDQGHPAESVDMTFVTRPFPFGDEHRFDLGQPAEIETSQRARFDKVLAAFRVKGDDVADEHRQRPGQRRDRSAVAAQHPPSELVAGCVGKEGETRFQAEPQRVVGDQPFRERMVSGHDRLAGLAVTGFAPRYASGTRETGFLQATADPVGEFARGLGREGEPEHGVGRHLTGHDQPHDPGGHHRGLARTSPGDDHPGLQRSGRRRDLLIGERHPEEITQLRRHQVQPRRSSRRSHGHVITCCPSSWAGQHRRNVHVGQDAPGRGGKRSASMCSTASNSRSSTQVGPSTGSAS